MLFWCIIIAISICVAGFLAATLSIPTPEAKETEQELHFYKAQLEEIKRDTARGLILDREAEHLGIEIKRRILALDKPASGYRPLDIKPWPFLGGIIISIKRRIRLNFFSITILETRRKFVFLRGCQIGK